MPRPQTLQSDREGIGTIFTCGRRRISFAPATVPAGSSDVGRAARGERTSARLTAPWHHCTLCAVSPSLT